jgi:enediyne biosynthesis protein E4
MSFVRPLLFGLALHAFASIASAQSMFTNQAAMILGGASLNARSASLADIDNDGDLDLFFQGSSGARQLFRNNVVGSGTFDFTNISSSLASGLGDSWSAAWGDYDGNGFVDVFVGQTNSGASGDVLSNNGSGFTNPSSSIGLDDPGFHQNVAWADMNNDRRLDLVIGMEGPERHEIYLQGADGEFTPVGAATGFQTDFGYKAYGTAIGDTDGDGDLDVYISTCRSGGNIRNNFYENQLVETGTLGFVDIADSNGTQNLDNSYHAEFVDFDDDGKLDLFMVGADQEETRIFRNDGDNQFTDVAESLGHTLLSDVGGDLNGGKAIDYDNDGDLDLFMHDNLSRNGSNQARKLYRNDGDWNFVDVTTQVGIASTNEGAYDSVWGDLDLDGDQDLVAPTFGGVPERLFLSSASENGNHWLYLQLGGARDNTSAIGATVYATINEGTPEERTLRREANTNAGTFNQSDVPVHFGFGDVTLIDELRIVWPDGRTQWHYDVSVDQYLAIQYGDLDGDGDVDSTDLVGWQTDFGVNGESDADGDGDTDGADFLAWQRALGLSVLAGSTGAANSIPEPHAAALALSAIATLLGSRKRRR